MGHLQTQSLLYAPHCLELNDALNEAQQAQLRLLTQPPGQLNFDAFYLTIAIYCHCPALLDISQGGHRAPCTLTDRCFDQLSFEFHFAKTLHSCSRLLVPDDLQKYQ